MQEREQDALHLLRPEPYVNEDATLYTKVWVEPKPTYYSSCTYSGGDMEQVERCCRIIADRGIDITATYDDWFHVGAALASLGERGRRLFHLGQLAKCEVQSR